MVPSKDYSDSGLLLVDKPEDWTSHDVVNLVRRRFRVDKVGHCGTLDPAATGLLVLVLGRATKLSSRLMTQDKVYTGSMCLGVETHTQDREGEVIATRPIDGVGEAEVRAAAARFTGELLQIPPMISAVKVDGKRLYQLGRRGEEVEREARPVTISSFSIDAVELPLVRFTVHCSKGTYVRTLCADMGTLLGCGAHLASLRRLRSGAFRIEDAVTVEEIKGWDREAFLTHITPMAQVVMGLMEH